MAERKREPVIGIVMASNKDLPSMRQAAEWLAARGIPSHMTAISAAREPDVVREYALAAQGKFRIIIAGSGGTNELALMLASYTLVPVLAVPLQSADGPTVPKQTAAVLSSLETPPGLPVATFGLDGVVNAAVFAAQMLAVTDARVRKILEKYRAELADAAVNKRTAVEAANDEIQAGLAPAPA